MKFSQTQKLIFTLILLVIVGFVVYNLFFATNNTVSPVSGEATTTISIEGQDIINLASKINTVSIDSSLFSSPLFIGLVDFDQPLTPEPQGRPNPFASIGNDSGTSIIVATTSLLKSAK